MRAVIVPAAIAALALTFGDAHAQSRSPSQRQTLTDLAYVLGEAHALRQVCQGPDDQFWRNRMIRLVDTEAPDATFEHRLREAFNTGFSTRRGQYPSCGGGARQALSSTLAEGRRLSDDLARARADRGDDSMADEAAPR